MSMAFSAQKRRRGRVLEKCEAMRAAKARRRVELAGVCGGWERVATLVLMVSAAPDGRSIAVRACHGRGEWQRCGSVRAVRGALTRLIWSQRDHATGGK